ncbi:hypothetical protein M5K25_012245 [Dendrobium thyrsiflorum]|uniref:Protein FAR1-RELATED SEQUENCE n=1 Tax=Dendrobium thyrsiflorum TaxID=117978 RepID=A0ABD0V3N4_DENTH
MKIAIGARQPTRNPRRGQEVETGARWRRQGSLRFCSSKSRKSAAEEMADITATTSALIEEVGSSGWMPTVNMLFDSENDAYDFYGTYAENVGFFVRRSTLWTTSKNIVTRRTFVCSREGFREKKKGAKEVKSPRPETRIGCQACMTIRLTTNGKYRVTEFVPSHNHPLATATSIQMLKAKKMRRKARAARVDLVDDSVKTPEFETEDEAYEFYNMYAGRMGFTVRRASMTVTADDVITRRMFVCSKEGFRERKKGAKRVKKPRPETRTGCPACMIIRITPGGKYHVSEFVTYHNHPLSAPSANDLLVSQNSETGVLDDESGMTDVLMMTPMSTDNSGNIQARELLNFYEHYNKLLDERRFAELQADAHASQSARKLPSMRVLRQAADSYTPAAFKMFEKEFEFYMDCMLYSCGEIGTISEYKVTMDEKPKDHFVKFDSLDGSITCSCKKFDFIGIPCHHMLKVLDSRNIKDLPPEYVLKRWRKDAKVVPFSGIYDFPFDGNPQTLSAKRYNYLCRIFSIAASRASKSFDTCVFIENQSDLLMEQVEHILRVRSIDMPSLITAPCDRAQNSVESIVTGGFRHDRVNQGSFVGANVNGFLGSRLSHPTMCWGQFPAGPPEQ